MTGKELKTYVVIDFPLHLSKDGKLKIDVVPRNWLIQKTKSKKDRWKCTFPSENDYTKVKRWVKNQKTPKDDWPTYPVTVLSSTDDLGKAYERMKRGFKTRDIESGSDVQDPKDPQELSTNPDPKKQQNPPITEKDASTMLDQVTTYSMNLSGKDSQVLSPGSNMSGSIGGRTPVYHEFDDYEQDDVYQNNSQDISTTSVNSERSRGKRDLSPSNDNPLRQIKRKLYHVEAEELAELIDTKIRRECANMESRILTEIRKSKRSTEYELRKQVEQLMNVMGSNGLKKKIDLDEIKKSISDHSLPIKNEIIFDELLENIAEKPEVKEALVKFIAFKRSHCSKPKELLENVLKDIMAKEVQLLYSACGKIQRGVGKKKLTSTSLYECLTGEIINYFPEDVTAAQLVTFTSRFLANAGDRDGGKKIRDQMRDRTNEQQSYF